MNERKFFEQDPFSHFRPKIPRQCVMMMIRDGLVCTDERGTRSNNVSFFPVKMGTLTVCCDAKLGGGRDWL